jgi:F-type H+-transporting ATPase subunit b
MLIDWFTVGAQALNFLLLVWLLKHFLYKPILNAIDAREKRIAKELADADAKKAEAQKEHDEFQHKNEEFDQQRAALLTKAMEEAKAERQRLLDEARKAADAASAKRQESLRRDAHNLNQALSRLTRQEVFAIARKTLTDLATTSLEERLGEVFTRRLRTMDGKAKAGLGEALKKASEPALLRSAFDLPAEQRAKIQNALNETFSAEIHIRFETAPDLVSGVELSTNGEKVAWSIADYLASMEKSVGDLLKEKDKPVAKADPKSEAKADPKPETKVDPKPEAKVAPKPKEPKLEVKPEPKTEAKPKAESEPKSVTEPEVKPGPKPEVKVESEPEAGVQPKAEAKARTPSDLPPQIFTRLHELYEELGREEVKAAMASERTEGETRKDDATAGAESKPEPRSEVNVEPKPGESKASPINQ